MKVNQNKIRVVVPEKEYEEEPPMKRADEQTEWNITEGYNLSIDQTLQSELPDVNECACLDVEKIKQILDENTEMWFDSSGQRVYAIKEEGIDGVANAIATSTEILKWRER